LARASEVAERAGDRQLTIMVANTKGLIYWTLNDLDKALLHVKQALALAEQEDIKTEVASSLNNLGLLVRDKGDPLPRPSTSNSPAVGGSGTITGTSASP
jgi:tetratricopeptide (TPR) repeat protein